MKKFLLLFIAIILVFTLTACGDKESDNNLLSEGETSNTESTNNLNLYSDNSKIVFANGQSKLVFYHDGNVITGYHVYIDYENAETANLALSVLEKDEAIEKAYTNGKYLIIEYAESEYKEYSLEDIKTTYSTLKEVLK